MDAFLQNDVVEITRQIVRGLVQAGCRYIQIDAPGYTAYVDKVSLERMRSRGEDPEQNMERSVAADNAVIAGFDDVTFGIHLCKGNPRTIDPATGKVMPQWSEGHYDGIAERLFSRLKHHRLLLEYDDKRSGSFAPLRYVPKDTIVARPGDDQARRPGAARSLRRRIDEATRYLPAEQLALTRNAASAASTTSPSRRMTNGASSSASSDGAPGVALSRLAAQIPQRRPRSARNDAPTKPTSSMPR